jgi:carboxylate-amine ligase
VSGATVPAAEQVLGRVPALPDGATVTRELRLSQVETTTGICSTADEVRTHLTRSRRALAVAAKAAGCAVVATATPVEPDAGTPQRPNTGRYAGVDAIYRGVVSDFEVSGCHVHVGVPDRDTAVAVVNHLGRWLPTLLALSANSPFDHRRDTGHDSWRGVLQSRFPGSGITPWFGGYAEYRAMVATLVDCGTLVDEHHTFWFARPSGRFPTVELRIADTALTVDDAVLQALLSRALVRTALTELAAGREAERLDPQVGAAALWVAARHGLTGPAVDPLAGRPVAAGVLVRRLVAHCTDALEEAGDLVVAGGLLNQVLHKGNGAQRQRGAALGGPGAVHRMLMAETTPS